MSAQLSYEERREQEKKQEKLNEQKAGEIATLFKGILQPPVYEHGYCNHFTIKCRALDTDCELHLSFGGYQNAGRVCVSGRYCHDIPWKEKAIQITIDASKDAFVIAKDISRRFLPKYVMLQTICLENKNRADAFKNKYQAVLNELLVHPAITKPAHRDRELYLQGKIGGKIDCISADARTCDLELRNISVDVVHALINLATSYKAPAS